MRSRVVLVLIVQAAAVFVLGGVTAATTAPENATPGNETTAIEETTAETATTATTTAETTVAPTTTTAVETTTTPTRDPLSALAGSGTTDDPYVIDRADQFALIDGDLDATYVLGSDLDFSGTAVDPIGENYTYDEPSRRFNGTLDGQGHTIENVTIAGPRMPLIRTVGETGCVESLSVGGLEGSGTAAVVGVNFGTIEHVHVAGRFVGSGEYASGPLVEFNDGTMRSVSGHVTVTGSPPESARYPAIGGLVGHNTGLIENATVRGSVVGTTDNGPVGGLVATNDRGGRIVDATSHATVEGSDGVGGLVGFNGRATIADSRATGSVTGEYAVGGLIGQAHAASLEGAFATGQVSGSTNVGGIVGTVTDPVDLRAFADGAYFDTEATGQEPVFANTGRTTAEMTGPDAREHLSALDFTSTWSTTAEYPTLQHSPRTGPRVTVTIDSGRVGPNGTATATVGLSSAPDGLSGYNVSVALSNTSVASIESVSAPDRFGSIKRVEQTENGAVFTVSDGADAVSGGERNVTLATVTLRTQASGTTHLQTSIDTVMADDGSEYMATTESERLEVVDVTAEAIDGTKPQDIDDDWNYEDLNGNGKLDFDDVNTFFQNSDRAVVIDHTSAYDFDGDGTINLQDVMALFEMV